MNPTETSTDKHHGVPLVPDETARQLNPRQLEDYRTHRKQLIDWTATIGKNPEKAEGYADETVYQRAYRLDRFYQYVWDEEDRYITQITVLYNVGGQVKQDVRTGRKAGTVRRRISVDFRSLSDSGRRW